MYKIEQPFNDFLSYEYNDSKEMAYMFMNSTSAISEHALSSANDIILDWINSLKKLWKVSMLKLKKRVGVDITNNLEGSCIT